jgi:predicted adenylyl cyclase CyaB
MARNVEIKARIAGWQEMRDRIEKIVRGPGEKLEQEDVFFSVPRGRVKVRTVNGKCELIYYFRENATHARESNYLIIPVENGARTREMLTAVHGEIGVVRKTRWLFMAGQTRIHLDQVEGLGDFLELEVVMREGQSAREGETIAGALMAQLGVEPDQLLDRAYFDYLRAK